MSRKDYSILYAEKINISFTFKKNGKSIPIEFIFKKPNEDDQLDLLADIDHLEKLTEFISQQEKTGSLEELSQKDDLELVKIIGKDKDVLAGVKSMKDAYGKMMGKLLISATGYNKKEHKNFKNYYDALHGTIRTTVYNEFIAISADEKKSSSEISLVSTTME